MKRRVSLAISCIGNPKIIFLDEPTTGLDPLTRLSIWKLIENMKKNRVIVLTTHSMFEGDALSDRIAIMKNGELKCIGNSIYLKNQYGKGYYINIITKKPEEIKKFVFENLNDSTLILENSGSLKFVVSHKKDIPNFFKSLENLDSNLLEDWSLNHTSKLTNKNYFFFIFHSTKHWKMSFLKSSKMMKIKILFNCNFNTFRFFHFMNF